MTKEQFEQLKEATQKLTRWDTTNKVFGHLNELEKKSSHVENTDRIYEFWCLLKILEDLKENFTITIVNGAANKFLFPQSPAPKKGWPYFLIESKTNVNVKFQVCYGTKIKLSFAPQTTIAPDISFQCENSTEDPDESMVKLVLDAKYKSSEKKTIQINLLHEFIQIVRALSTNSSDLSGLLFYKLQELKSNCLLTNGQGLKNQKDYCKHFNVKQVVKFDIKMQYEVIG